MVRVWCDTPRWRSRSSANEARQAGNGDTPQRRSSVQYLSDFHTAETESGSSSHDARSHGYNHSVHTCQMACDSKRRVDGDGFEVAPEGMSARNGGVNEFALCQLVDQVGQCKRQPGSVGHHIPKATRGGHGLECCCDSRNLAVQCRSHYGNTVDRLNVGELCRCVFLGAADVGLEACVPALYYVTGSRLAPRGALQVPVHHVPAARSEAQFHGCGVDYYAVTRRHVARELGEYVGPFGTVSCVHLDALKPWPFLEDPHDLSGLE